MKERSLSKVQVIILCIAVVFLFITSIGKVNAQESYTFIKCLDGYNPDEVSWKITECSGKILIEGGAPFMASMDLPKNYRVIMEDSYGDGWSDSFLFIGDNFYTFYPKNNWLKNNKYKEVSVGCSKKDLKNPIYGELSFYPTEFYNQLGDKLYSQPDTGWYIASNGIIKKIVYEDEIK